MIAFIYPITATIKPFLASKGHNVEEVEKMHQAWFKSVTLQVTLWVYPMQKITILALHIRLGFLIILRRFFDMSASALPSPSQSAQSAHGK